MALETLNLANEKGKKFYVYIYRDPRPNKNYCPIYVGKGINKRAKIHWYCGSDNRIFARILDKLKHLDLKPIIEIVAWFDDENAAFDLERELIALIGRRDQKKGPLANMTDGGDGASGVVMSAGTKAKIKAGNLIAKAAIAADPARSAAQSEQRSDLRKAAWSDPVARARYTESIRAAKEAKSAKMKAYWADPERRERHAANVSASTKAAWADTETRKKRVDAIRMSRRSPSNRGQLEGSSYDQDASRDAS